MGVEIVLHQNDELGAGKVDVGQLFEGLGIVHGGAAVRDFDPHFRGGGPRASLRAARTS